MSDHEWHTFDVERDLEVRCVDDRWEVRRRDRSDDVTSLTAVEFDQLRQDGPNPRGLD